MRFTPTPFYFAPIPLCVCAALVISFPALAEPRGTGNSTIRIQSEGLPAKSTAKNIEYLLENSHWSYSNPDKKHSLWESKAWRFGADGEVVITTFTSSGPRQSISSWKIQRRGDRPLIKIGDRRYRLRGCKHRSYGGQTWCLFGASL